MLAFLECFDVEMLGIIPHKAVTTAPKKRGDFRHDRCFRKRNALCLARNLRVMALFGPEASPDFNERKCQTSKELGAFFNEIAGYPRISMMSS